MLKEGLFILVLLIALVGYAQEDEYVYGDKASSPKPTSSSGFDWQRATIGGGFYAAFGSNSYFLIAPTFGYHLTDNFLVGAGINYVYEKVSVNVSYPYKNNTYGGSIFSQFKFGNLPILAHAELELATINVNFDSKYAADLNLNLVNPYVGGGLKQQIGKYSYLYALILFNLNETQQDIYQQPNPTIRIGIAIGL